MYTVSSCSSHDLRKHHHFEDYQNPITPFFPIYRSTNHGANWSYYSQINDTHHSSAWGMHWEPQLYELPQQVGSWPAGLSKPGSYYRIVKRNSGQESKPSR